MKLRIRSGLALAVAAGGAVCLGMGPAEAHVLSSYSMNFSAGVLHPLTGLDHLLALLAIGLWAGSRDDIGISGFAALLVGSLAAGFATGVIGLALPFVEPALLTSVVVLGLLGAAATTAPRFAGFGLVAGFAFLHGHAHGAEAMGGSLAGFLGGFLLTSLCVIAFGFGAAALGRVRGAAYAPRLASGAIAVSGLALAALSLG